MHTPNGHYGCWHMNHMALATDFDGWIAYARMPMRYMLPIETHLRVVRSGW